MKFRYRAVDVMKLSTFRTALALPCIIRRIEHFLVVKELNAKLFNHSIHEDQLLAATSAPSSGYEVDYERLELLGLLPHCIQLIAGQTFP